MSRDTLIALMGGYGYKIEREYLAEYKTRFRNEEGRGLIDIWMGRKGTTMGVYNPRTSTFWFKKQVDLNEIEKGLLWVEDYYRKHG